MLGIAQYIHKQVDQKLALVLFFLAISNVLQDGRIMKMCFKPGIRTIQHLFIEGFQVFINDGGLKEGHFILILTRPKVRKIQVFNVEG